jgi:TatD DNase family protein
MIFIDSHTHMYLDDFDGDRHAAVRRAIDTGVTRMLLPNIDRGSVNGMLELCRAFPDHCFPMMGLHPTSVREDFSEHLEDAEAWLQKEHFIAIGETGIDLYWDKSFRTAQEASFRHQIALAKKHNLPVVIHSRNSFQEIFDILDDTYEPGLKGVFHCFTGNHKQAEKILGWGFKLGIGGVLTFKNSGLDAVAESIGLEHMILETDAPFLSPVPYRGKRNESAYTRIVAEKLADVKQLSIEEVAEVTTQTAIDLFKLDGAER